MRLLASAVLAAALSLLAPVAGRAALAPYNQNFEGMTRSNSTALSSDGWLVYGNVFSPDHANFLYGYGPFGAPNGSGAFCALDTLQGGPLQGNLQLSVYSDYNNTGAHGAGDQVESNVYHEQTIAAADVGNTWTFQFDAKLGNISGTSTALGFIKTINPSAGYAQTNLVTVNTTAIPANWNTYTISLAIDASLVGQLMQFGFSNTATSFQPSGIFYDNLVWKLTAGVGVSGSPAGGAFALGAAAPNPTRGAMRIDYALAQRGAADLAVYDIAGRRVATLFHGVADAGPHIATWSGRADDGHVAPSGVYWCVYQSSAGRQSRKLVLSR